MDKECFLKETTDYIESVYRRFELYQSISWDILKEFDRVCKIRSVRYWLAYGTLLGAIRDHGQVPWDYDVDVVSFFDEREKLILALESELSDEYYYTYVNNTDHYPGGHRLLRVCKRGYSMIALHLDVFFLLGASEDEKKMIKYHKKMLRLQTIYDIKCLPYHYVEEVKGRYHKYIKKLLESIYSLIPLNLLKKIEYCHLTKYSVKEMIYIPFYGIVVPISFFETSYVHIDDIDLPIPVGYDIILERIYGNYKEYPSIKSRFNEFYEHTLRISLIQDSYTK